MSRLSIFNLKRMESAVGLRFINLVEQGFLGGRQSDGGPLTGNCSLIN